METKLRLLIPHFLEHAPENGRKMREFLDADRAAFPLAATRILQDWSAERDAATQKGYGYLVTILLTQDLLFPLFLDSAIPLPLCMWMAQTAAKVDSRFHLHLSNVLQDGMREGGDLGGGGVTRVLEILSAMMEPAAMAPLLRKILLHPNATIRSKATLLMGRGETGIGAIERLLPDEDPRVRANALESLWSNPDPRVVPMFLAGLKDPNNRVIGNAILGLYTVGSTKAIAAAFDLSHHSDATFRGTAAWAMGATGDPRFVPILGKLVGESTGQLRKIVFKALQTIKKSNAAHAERTMKLTVLSSYVDGARWHLRVSVKDISSGGSAALPATAFIIGAESESAADYSCEQNLEKRLVIEFVIPSIGESSTFQPTMLAAIANFRAKKAEQERWQVSEYSSIISKAEPLGPFKFIGVEALPRVDEPAIENFTPDLFGVIGRAIQNSRPSPIPRHLVVMASKFTSALDAESERKLIASGRAKGIPLHVLSLSADDQLKRVSQRLAGSFQVLTSLERIEEELEGLYDRLTSYYAIDVPASILDRKSSGPITVQVNAATGWGKCEVDLPV